LKLNTNRSISTLLRYQKEQLPGCAPIDLVPEEDDDAYSLVSYSEEAADHDMDA
jgi:hypothetical protein